MASSIELLRTDLQNLSCVAERYVKTRDNLHAPRCAISITCGGELIFARIIEDHEDWEYDDLAIIVARVFDALSQETSYLDLYNIIKKLYISAKHSQCDWLTDDNGLLIKI